MSVMVFGSIPYFCSPARASPDSFNSTLLYRGLFIILATHSPVEKKFPLTDIRICADKTLSNEKAEIRKE
jgi:hypothetical protein